MCDFSRVRQARTLLCRDYTTDGDDFIDELMTDDGDVDIDWQAEFRSKKDAVALAKGTSGTQTCIFFQKIYIYWFIQFVSKNLQAPGPPPCRHRPKAAAMAVRHNYFFSKKIQLNYLYILLDYLYILLNCLYILFHLTQVRMGRRRRP